MRNMFYRFLVLLPVAAFLVLFSIGQASAANVAASIQEFKVNAKGKWVIVFNAKNNTKDRSVTALSYKLTYTSNGKNNVYTRPADNKLKLKKAIAPGKSSKVNFTTNVPMNGTISNAKVSILSYSYKKYTRSNVPTRSTSNADFSIKNVTMDCRYSGNSSVYCVGYCDLVNNRNDAEILRVDDLTVYFNAKNYIGTKNRSLRYKIGNKNVKIRPLGTKRIKFSFTSYDTNYIQHKKVRVVGTPRFGQKIERSRPKTVIIRER